MTKHKPGPIIYKTQQELDHAVQLWQARLRLSDWHIMARIRRQFQMSEGSQGDVGWEPKSKSATIRLLDPIDYDPNFIHVQDHEKTLVHEMVHLFFPREGNEQYEPEIESLACAFISLSRGFDRATDAYEGAF